MKQIQRNLGLTLAAALAVTVLAVGPVSAEQSRSGKTEATTAPTAAPTPTPTHAPEDASVHSTTSTSSGSGKTSTTASTETHTSDDATTNAKVSGLQQQAAALLKDQRGQKPTTTPADRQKACQARQAELNRKIASYNSKAKQAMDTYDAVLAKLLAYKADKNLTIADYDALTQAAADKKAAAATAVAALAKVSVTIDCTAPDPAAAVATIKTAVDNARTALADYRSAIKDILSAILKASGSTSGTSGTGGTPPSSPTPMPTPKPTPTPMPTPTPKPTPAPTPAPTPTAAPVNPGGYYNQ